MKRLMINVVVVAVGLAVSLHSRTSEAGEHDLRVGTYEGNWMGYEARFEILEKVENKWEFHGKILIKKTKEYDKIHVKQYADNHLGIVRTLTNPTRSQGVVTHPPKTVKENGNTYVNFRVKSGDGPGSNNLGHLNMPVAPPASTAGPTTTPASSARAIVCTPVDWVQVNLDGGLRWFGRDVPGMREAAETKDSLTAMLKKHGFETQLRRVDGAGGSVKTQLFARLTKQTTTPNSSGKERMDREVKAIADMVYGGEKAVGKKVYATK